MWQGLVILEGTAGINVPSRSGEPATDGAGKGGNSKITPGPTSG